MLQRRGRLTYGALKRQFNLDDAYLEDVKAELIEGNASRWMRTAVVLVWDGSCDVPSRTTPPAPSLGPACHLRRANPSRVPAPTRRAAVP